jgi:zinc transport system ATP-binding protein
MLTAVPDGREIAIRFESVSFSYSDAQVLVNAEFHIHRGEFVAMVGPNGAGKTTVLKLILGLEVPSSGTIRLFGAGRSACRIGFVPQQLPADNAFPIMVRDIVRMGLLLPLSPYKTGFLKKTGKGNFSLPEKDAVSEAMEQADISGLARRSYGELSGGQRRRALVARALVSKPDILILDEPTANMDEESERRLFETLGRLKGGTTILIVTHDTEFVSALTDRVLCLGDGSRGIVQHRVEAVDGERHGGPVQAARVVHAENIPADECC